MMLNSMVGRQDGFTQIASAATTHPAARVQLDDCTIRTGDADANQPTDQLS